MPTRHLVLAFVLASCGTAPGTPDGGGATTWFTTCGDPVCNTWTEHPGVPLCTTETVGATCTTPDARCDPKNDCNALLTCAASDPKLGPGGCPISRRKYKKDVRYLDDDARARLHAQLRDLRLATYRYANAPPDGPEHLGFLIDDVGGGPAIDPVRDQVDLYGYTSLAIAALQVQAAELETLRREVAALKAERPACPSPPAERSPRKR